MSVKVSISQLQKELPEIINRAVAEDDVCVVERNGENIAVIVSLRVWQQHRTVGEQLDALGSEYRLSIDKQQRTEELLAKERLTRTEEKELEALLNEADKILLRRAKALDNLRAAFPPYSPENLILAFQLRRRTYFFSEQLAH